MLGPRRHRHHRLPPAVPRIPLPLAPNGVPFASRMPCRDGVWLVELASIMDPALAPSTVAQVLCVQEKAGVPVLRSIVTQLSGRQLLLLVDNCEHLREACVQLIDLVLRKTFGTMIIATSREPLHSQVSSSMSCRRFRSPTPKRTTNDERLGSGPAFC